MIKGHGEKKRDPQTLHKEWKRAKGRRGLECETSTTSWSGSVKNKGNAEVEKKGKERGSKGHPCHNQEEKRERKKKNAGSSLRG